VLGADTIVVIGDEVLEKPRDEADARRMLENLSGRTHEVMTAVALCRGPALVASETVCTRVTFAALPLDVVQRYAASGEGLDKAGAYAIQGLGAGIVRAIEGSYTNVVGLPTVETLALLRAAGVVRSWP
jgi:septum formation protein